MRGLGAIDEQGLIHRDLKPANVMVTSYPPGHAGHRALVASGGCARKIIDFGLGRATKPAHFTDVPLTIGFRGTATYASPEQCAERTDLDARSDLYALTGVFSEAARGHERFGVRLACHRFPAASLESEPLNPDSLRRFLSVGSNRSAAGTTAVASSRTPRRNSLREAQRPNAMAPPGIVGASSAAAASDSHRPS